MEGVHPFKEKGKWFKGNLHCHSTVSDGKLPPDEVVKIYKENGWNFLAFTEHEKYSNYGNKYDTEDFITIPGTESSNNDFAHYNYNHLFQELIDMILSQFAFNLF
jgi:histidinol phosphatase-like PHP family hydrolase